MCQVIKVSRSSYYSWILRRASKRALYNQMLLQEIKRIFVKSKSRYGSPRIAKELEMIDIKASRQLVSKLIRAQNMPSIIKRKFKITTDSSHKYPVAQNVLNREFIVASKNVFWVSDITYIRTKKGWLYLTTVIDLFDRKVIGWSLSDTMKAKDTSVKSLKWH